MTSQLPAPLVAAIVAGRIGVPAFASTPRVLPPEYVRVAARGGSRGGSGQLSKRVLQVYAYAPSLGAAADLGERAVQAILAAGLDPAETRLRASSVAAEPADGQDPDSGVPRVTATVLVTLRHHLS